MRRWLRLTGLICAAAMVTTCASLPQPDVKRDPVPRTAVRVTWDEALGQGAVTDPDTIDHLLTLLRTAERIPETPEIDPGAVRVSFIGTDGAVSRFALYKGQVFDPEGALLRGPAAERFVGAAESLVGGGKVLAGRMRAASTVTLVAADAGIQIPLTADQRAQLAGFFEASTNADRGPMGGAVYPNVTIRMEGRGTERLDLRLNSAGYGSVPGRYFTLPPDLWPTVMTWLSLPSATPDQLAYLFQATHLQMAADLGETEQPLTVDHTFDLNEFPRNAIRTHHFVRVLLEGEPSSLAGEESQVVGIMGFTVADELLEVKLLQDGFIYQGRSYRLPGLKGRIRAIMTAG